MYRNLLLKKIFLIILFSSSGCNSFRYGWTQDWAFNSYMLINEDKKNFGNRRIKYNLGHHGKSDLYEFLKVNQYPNFIYEYETSNKTDIIVLFYVQQDSAYLFREISNWNPTTVLRERRKMTPQEHEAYKKLVEKQK